MGADSLEADARGWAGDVSALLALPALWVDREPREIANGLLSVLFGVLRLDSAFARFVDAGGDALEVWRPAGSRPPRELARMLQRVAARGAGIVVAGSEPGEVASRRVVALPVALPWESGVVVVSASRPGFPTADERQLLRAAVGQAAIAIHAAQRLEQEAAARRAAEDALLHQQELLRSLARQVAPELAALARTIHDAGLPDTTAVRDGSPALTDREAEVLRLLAQGLSNKEIAAVLWLSDRTVERHITSMYRKIGVARRSEATAFALRHGVV